MNDREKAHQDYDEKVLSIVDADIAAIYREIPMEKYFALHMQLARDIKTIASILKDMKDGNEQLHGPNKNKGTS